MARFDTGANIGIVLLCVFVCGDVAYRYLARAGPRAGAQVAAAGPSRAQRPIEYRPGDRLDGLPGIDFKRSRHTLLVVVRSGCRYCQESTPFYRLLAASAKTGLTGVTVVGVCTESMEACVKFLAQEKVDVAEAVGVSPGTLRIRGTPTLILVDGTGTVARLWTGKLAKDGEREVLQALRAGS